MERIAGGERCAERWEISRRDELRMCFRGFASFLLAWLAGANIRAGGLHNPPTPSRELRNTVLCTVDSCALWALRYPFWSIGSVMIQPTNQNEQCFLEISRKIEQKASFMTKLYRSCHSSIHVTHQPSPPPGSPDPLAAGIVRVTNIVSMLVRALLINLEAKMPPTQAQISHLFGISCPSSHSQTPAVLGHLHTAFLVQAVRCIPSSLRQLSLVSYGQT